MSQASEEPGTGEVDEAETKKLFSDDQTLDDAIWETINDDSGTADE
jgi:hypothetical protein